jgi:large subunit ribosomal protein L7/L12
MFEVHLLTELLQEKLMPAGIKMASVTSSNMAEADQEHVHQEESNLQEKDGKKNTFDVKLLGFDAKNKIKVIKEVRAITGLGLKEAKELVEGAPVVIQKNVPKERADELQKKLTDICTVEVL